MALQCQTELNTTKAKFFEELKYVCPDFVVDDNNRQIIGDVFQWCIRNKKGAFNPAKGLWICGNIGTGKSTIMKAILQFITKYWLRDSGEKINPQWVNIPTFCGRYATNGFDIFNTIPMGLDELGTEITPTNHVGNKLNVVAHLISTIYDHKSDIPHIVTTNCTLRETLEMYGPRTIDRMGQLFNIVEIKGASRRNTSKIWNLIKSVQEDNKK